MLGAVELAVVAEVSIGAVQVCLQQQRPACGAHTVRDADARPDHKWERREGQGVGGGGNL